MNDMVERVARALEDEHFKFAVPDSGGHPKSFYWHELSRAAIAAMREPTPTMQQAGKFRCHGVDVNDGSMRRACGGFLGETTVVQWRRMIDDALEERLESAPPD